MTSSVTRLPPLVERRRGGQKGGISSGSSVSTDGDTKTQRTPSTTRGRDEAQRAVKVAREVDERRRSQSCRHYKKPELLMEAPQKKNSKSGRHREYLKGSTDFAFKDLPISCSESSTMAAHNSSASSSGTSAAPVLLGRVSNRSKASGTKSSSVPLGLPPVALQRTTSQNGDAPPTDRLSRSRKRMSTWPSSKLSMASTAVDFNSDTGMQRTSTGTLTSSEANTLDPGFKIRTWHLGSLIGEGSYGGVYKALETTTGFFFAVKRANTANCSDKLEDELAIIRHLRHPNIVSYFGFERQESCIFIFMEYAVGGSLSSILGEFGPLQGALLRSVSTGALRGLDYLHTRSPVVCHRDVKCANILVDENFCAKLADFGCSKRDDVTTSFTTVGSILWMAPEVILQDVGYGRKADVWSFGCTVIEMATAETPWGKDMVHDVISALRLVGMSELTPPIPRTMPKGLYGVVSSCLNRVASERPSASNLLERLESLPE